MGSALPLPLREKCRWSHVCLSPRVLDLVLGSQGFLKCLDASETLLKSQGAASVEEELVPNGVSSAWLQELAEHARAVHSLAAVGPHYTYYRRAQLERQPRVGPGVSRSCALVS